MKTLVFPTPDEVACAYDQKSWLVIEENHYSLCKLHGIENLIPIYSVAFCNIKSWKGRKSILFFLLKYARKSERVRQIAVRALSDRAEKVREGACGILAFSLESSVIPALEPLTLHASSGTREAAAAAIDAIRNKNHNLFLDREHSGNVLWQVKPAA